MDERELIDALLTAAAAPAGTGVVLGPGDDAAVLRPTPGTEWVWTVDDQVEGAHFRAAWCSPEDAGRKAAGASLSDLAAMGATPRHALLALTVPTGFDAAQAAALGRGLRAGLGECPLVGGNVAAGERLGLSLSVLGEVPTGRALTRSGAQVGDTVFVSGALGLARLGLLHLEAGGDPQDEALAFAVNALLRPTPRIALGLVLRDAGRLACMDISDGLAQDLPRLLRASGVAARVASDLLPAPPAEAAERLGVDPTETAWLGGEDYELLVAGPRSLAELGLTPVGEVVAGAAGSISLTGPLAGRALEGFDHLR